MASNGIKEQNGLYWIFLESRVFYLCHIVITAFKICNDYEYNNDENTDKLILNIISMLLRLMIQ